MLGVDVRRSLEVRSAKNEEGLKSSILTNENRSGKG
jgi:hypothetical protein